MAGDQLLGRLMAEERDKPLLYYPHYTNAFEDDRKYSLFMEGGWAYYGLYCYLCEIVAAREFHCFPMHDKGQRLAYKMHLTLDELQAFLSALKACGLLVEESLNGGLLRLREIDEAAEFRAKETAPKRLGAAKTNAKRNASNNASDHASGAQ